MLRYRCSKCHKRSMKATVGTEPSITTITAPPKHQRLCSPSKVTIGQRGRRGCQAVHGTPSSLLCRIGPLQPLRKCNNYCVCVCVYSLPVPGRLDAFTLRKYDPKPGQNKLYEYDFVVETLKKDTHACLSKVDKVLTNRCTRGGTTPLLHHTTATPT